MPAMKTVYDCGGDEPRAIEVYAIVAAEIVASDPDRYSYRPRAAKAHKAAYKPVHKPNPKPPAEETAE